MTAVAAPVGRDVKSFRLSKPTVGELPACTFLSLAASGIWLLVLPLELIQLVTG